MCTHDDSVEEHIYMLNPIGDGMVCVAHPQIPIPHDPDQW